MESRLLTRVADLSVGRWAGVTSVAVTLLAIAAVWTNAQLKIGNPVEGSNLLWSDSEYNTAVRALNAHFPGMNTLEIVLEAKEIIRDRKVARTPEVMQTSMAIQRMMEADTAAPPRATLSFSDYMREMYRLFSGGHMSWRELDPTEEAVATAGFVATFGTSPDNYATVSDYQFQNSSVSVWYPDNRQETVDAALASARRAVAAVGEDHTEFRVRLGTGVIALQQATNEVIHRYHWLIVGLVNLAVFLMAAMAYRSAVAGLILLVPVNLSNFLLGSSMYLLGVGLDINATIVAVMGVGVGIDYGIYLLSRICEEYQARERNLEAAIRAALRTTGKAILFTATTMLLGIVPWYFLSDLKFMADMGVLLIGIMLINMLLSLIVLPLVVAWVRPRFLDRTDLAVGEAIDPSLLVGETAR
jgi:predicted RND superfamily exporter protein